MLDFIFLQGMLELGHVTVTLFINSHVGEGNFLSGGILALVELLQALGVRLMHNLAV